MMKYKFKKAALWTVWLGGCFTAGYVGTKVFLKASDWITEQLAECGLMEELSEECATKRRASALLFFLFEHYENRSE